LGFEKSLNVVASPNVSFSMCRWSRCLERHVNRTKATGDGTKVNLSVRGCFTVVPTWALNG
jgi:hypothetical protein